MRVLRGARCGNSARRDLRGGHRAIGVPTSIGKNSMMQNPWPKDKYWCYTSRSLDEIAHILQPLIWMSDWNSDMENVWEWYEGQDHHFREWNISRRHLGVTDVREEPVVFMAHPYPE